MSLLLMLQRVYFFECLQVFWLFVKYISCTPDEVLHPPWGSLDHHFRTAALREEYRLRMYDSWMQRTFGPKREEITGGCRQLHSKELQHLYSSPDIVWMNK